jgi:hypothetical protein
MDNRQMFRLLVEVCCDSSIVGNRPPTRGNTRPGAKNSRWNGQQEWTVIAQTKVVPFQTVAESEHGATRGNLDFGVPRQQISQCDLM